MMQGIDSTFDAAPGADGPIYTMQLLGNGSLLVDHCRIEEFRGGYSSGIAFQPGSIFPAPPGTGTLWVKDTILTNVGSNEGAIEIAPEGGVPAIVHLERVQILNAVGNGVRADASTGTPVDVELQSGRGGTDRERAAAAHELHRLTEARREAGFEERASLRGLEAADRNAADRHAAGDHVRVAPVPEIGGRTGAGHGA